MGSPLQTEPHFSLSPYSLNDTNNITSHPSSNNKNFSATNNSGSNNNKSNISLITPGTSTPSSPYHKQHQKTIDASASVSSSTTSFDQNGISVVASAALKRTNKTHVPSACVNCKRAHLACDVSRPCKRCVALGKQQSPHAESQSLSNYSSFTTPPPPPIPSSAQQSAQISDIHQNRQPFPPAYYQRSPNLRSPKFISIPSSANNIASPPHPPLTPPSSFLRSLQPQSPSPPSMPPQQPVTASPSSTIAPPLLSENSSVITMFLTVYGVAARVSDECLGIMGFYPTELAQKSLLDYVHPQDYERMQKLINSLMERAHEYNEYHQHNQNYPPSHHQLYSNFSGTSTINHGNNGNTHPQSITAKDSRFYTVTPKELMHSALMMNGSGNERIEATDYFNLQARNGQYDYYSVLMYLGGGLGGDLSRKETWGNLYIVGLFTRIRQNTGLSAATTAITSAIQNHNSSFTQHHNFPNIPPTMISSNSDGDHLNSPTLSPAIDPSLREHDHSLLSRSYTSERNQTSKEQLNYQTSHTSPLLSRSNIPSPLSLHAEKRIISSFNPPIPTPTTSIDPALTLYNSKIDIGDSPPKEYPPVSIMSPVSSERVYRHHINQRQKRHSSMENIPHKPDRHLKHQPLTPTYEHHDNIANPNTRMSHGDATSTIRPITTTSPSSTTTTLNHLFGTRSVVNELSVVGDDEDESTTRMSVNSLLCS
ncbi:13462_t:CDS:2 [Ambispora leptoticha]|uniref:13462_t:CDS:1 n=1 Tax=Ambispora leptoticha TaxID=144679 RepID=A0A9N8W0A2_9GLOM|nr:13462_t:CDS:2 [Ambispora leptoticha]